MNAPESNTAAKPYSCIRCHRQFRRAEHLSRHIRTHTKERPFLCETCGQAFTRKDLLKRHDRLAHSNDDTIRMRNNSNASIDRPVDPTNGGMQITSDQSLIPSPLGPQFNEAAQPTVAPTSIPANTSVTLHGPPLGSIIGQPQGQDAFPTPGQEFLGDSYNWVGQDFHMTDVNNYADAMGLPAGWFTFGYLDIPEILPSHEIQQGPEEPREIPQEASSESRANGRSRSESPFRPSLPNAPDGERGDVPISAYYTSPRPQSDSTAFSLSEAQRTWFAADLNPYKPLIPDFKLPSRHTLNRYLDSFREGFHAHMPFLHFPTFRPENTIPELIMACATIGAQYRFELRNARMLFRAAFAVVKERLRKYKNDLRPSLPAKRDSYGMRSISINSSSPSDPHISPQTAEGGDITLPQRELIESIATTFVLMGFAAWEGIDILQEAASLQRILVELVQMVGLEEGSDTMTSWSGWAQIESARRIRLVAFTWLNTMTIAYNGPPVLLSSSLKLRLPCASKLWNAWSEVEWRAAIPSQPQLMYQDALSSLFSDSKKSLASSPRPTPLGSYILLHGILQRIYLVRELSGLLCDSSQALPGPELEKFSSALRSWTTVWQATPESSLDPRNENGPIPFTTSSLLGLAYVRLHLNVGPHRHFSTRDPQHIAHSIAELPPIKRGPQLTSALLYGCHSLSIPVRLGVDYVSRTQAFFWSVRHSLSGFECAILLSNWLLVLDKTKEENPPCSIESRMLRWIQYIIREAWSSMDVEGEHMDYIDDHKQQELLQDLGQIAIAVVRIWARLFTRNVQWPFINVIGQSLAIYAQLLESHLDAMPT